MSKISNPNRRRRVAILIFLASYIASHFVISRVSEGMVRRDWGINDAFIYLPVRPGFVAEHEVPWLYIHHGMSILFFPIWKVDQHLFGGPLPMWSMPLLELGGGTSHIDDLPP